MASGSMLHLAGEIIVIGALAGWCVHRGKRFSFRAQVQPILTGDSLAARCATKDSADERAAALELDDLASVSTALCAASASEARPAHSRKGTRVPTISDDGGFSDDLD